MRCDRRSDSRVMIPAYSRVIASPLCFPVASSSPNMRISDSGVFSSCETLAMKSLFICEARRSARTDSQTTAQPERDDHRGDRDQQHPQDALRLGLRPQLGHVAGRDLDAPGVQRLAERRLVLERRPRLRLAVDGARHLVEDDDPPLARHHLHLVGDPVLGDERQIQLGRDVVVVTVGGLLGGVGDEHRLALEQLVQVAEVSRLVGGPGLQRLPLQPLDVALPAVHLAPAVRRVRRRVERADLERLVEQRHRLDPRRADRRAPAARRAVSSHSICLEQLAVGLVDAVLDLLREQVGELLVPLHQRRLAAHRRRHRVAVAVVGERHGRPDDGREDDGQDDRSQRDACALPGHRGWLRIARKPTPWPKSSATFSSARTPARPAPNPPAALEVRPRSPPRCKKGWGVIPSCGGGWPSPRPVASAPASKGPTIVVYPEAVWYVGVTPADVPEIVEQHMSGGRPVERLRRKDEGESTD